MRREPCARLADMRQQAQTECPDLGGVPLEGARQRRSALGQRLGRRMDAAESQHVTAVELHSGRQRR
jgi:hypothetical protein